VPCGAFYTTAALTLKIKVAWQDARRLAATTQLRGYIGIKNSSQWLQNYIV
jgi:hypothetical protein